MCVLYMYITVQQLIFITVILHIPMHTCIYMYILDVKILTHTRTHVRMQARTRARTHTHTHTHMYIHTYLQCTFIHACIHTCIHTNIHACSMHAYMHTYIHTYICDTAWTRNLNFTWTLYYYLCVKSH